MKRQLFLGMLMLIPLYLQGQIQFENVAFEKGVKYMKSAYTVGSGISFVDFNGDGWDDLTIGTPAGKFIDFYENKEGRFQRILPLVKHKDESKQVLWVDYDNDGDLDLYVASYGGPNRLYQNQGDLDLVDVTEASGLPMNIEYTFGATWGDYNRDGWLDLYFGNHKDVTPDKYNKLFKNLGNGQFEDVSEYSRTNDLNKVPYCSAFLDVNNDKWPDLYTANDKLTYNTMLLNSRNGKFEDVSTYSNSDLRMNAMCVAVGDYNNDGWQDIYITNTPIGNKLLKHSGQLDPYQAPLYEEEAVEAGVEYFGHGWASNFFDADNDGDLDLYVNGSAKIERYANRSSLLYENVGNGKFELPDVGMASDSALSFANAVGDINRDGYPDIVVQNNPPFLHYVWQNQGGNKNWLKIKLEGKLSNRDAIGAKIEVFAKNQYQMRYTHCGIGFLGQNSRNVHFGLDKLESIDTLLITWPSGHQDRFNNIASNQELQIKEGQSSNGQIDVDPDIRLLITSTKEEELLASKAIKISPNPAHSFIRLESKQALQESFLIYNSAGQLLKQGQIKGFNLQIPVHSLESGLYWIFLEKSGKIPFLIQR